MTEKWKKYRRVEEGHADLMRGNPERIESYMQMVLKEYEETNDNTVFLAHLRTIALAKGVSKIAAGADMSRRGLQNALSSEGNPRFENISAIAKAIGYRVTLAKIDNVGA